jgi:hypothetical protein
LSETGGLAHHKESRDVPSPQSLVAFVSTLFLMLVGTRVAFHWPPVACAACSVALAVGLAAIVERRIPHEDDDMDEVTQEAETGSASGE